MVIMSVFLCLCLCSCVCVSGGNPLSIVSLDDTLMNLWERGVRAVTKTEGEQGVEELKNSGHSKSKSEADAGGGDRSIEGSGAVAEAGKVGDGVVVGVGRGKNKEAVGGEWGLYEAQAGGIAYQVRVCVCVVCVCV